MTRLVSRPLQGGQLLVVDVDDENVEELGQLGSLAFSLIRVAPGFSV
jgi:hypothetical protein